MIFSEHCYIDAFGAPTGVETAAGKDRFHLVDLMLMIPLQNATGVLDRREAIMRAGPFDSTLRTCIDFGFRGRIAALRRGDIGEMLADHRKCVGQITGDRTRMRRNWLPVCGKLEAAGMELSPRDFARGHSRRAFHRSIIAYQAGNYADAGSLVVGIWRYAPTFAVMNPLARIRTLPIVASLFTDRAHKALRLRFNAARTRSRG